MGGIDVRAVVIDETQLVLETQPEPGMQAYFHQNMMSDTDTQFGFIA
ncbi:hypothetical protein [Sodalis sp.]